MYNYRENMIEDIKNYIEENGVSDFDTLYDNLWIADNVTGNGSGSYFFNSYKAAEALVGNNDLLCEALEGFGGDPDSYKKAIESPEYADVTIRCYLLGECLSECLENMNI